MLLPFICIVCWWQLGNVHLPKYQFNDYVTSLAMEATGAPTLE
jgi:hypothetical protein